MNRKDLKKYGVFLPIRWEHEYIFEMIERYIPGYCENIFRAYWLERYSMKIYWGEKQYVRIPEKDSKTYRYIPLSIWFDISEHLDGKPLDEKSWEWIKEQRKIYKTNSHKKVSNKNLLEI
jgi:hypothetical protein